MQCGPDIELSNNGLDCLETGQTVSKQAQRLCTYILVCVCVCEIYYYTHMNTEEAEMTENGEEVVGFGLRKLLKTVPKEANSDEKFNKPSPKPRKQFSLDFPPGLVHDESECVKSPKNWKIIKSILDEKRPKKTDKRKKLKI